MLPSTSVKPTVAIIGLGRLGTSLAMQLHRSGYTVSEVISRTPASARRVRAASKSLEAKSSDYRNLSLNADLIWLCVPDRQIASVAQKIAPLVAWKGKTVFHSSGALASDELEALRKRGATVASVHPMMTFVHGEVRDLRGVSFALEGDAAAARRARRVIRDLGARSFPMRKQNKAAYHAWGGFTSPLLVAALATAESVAKSAGLKPAEARRMMMPIVSQTLVNYSRLGPAASFTGPLIRGDAGVVKKHLQALKKTPRARAVYVALARSALRHLPVRNRREMGKILKA